jgi:hypothetical protein
VSTRAIIGFTNPDGTWRGVWNHWSGHTQHLGRALIKAVRAAKGDLDQVIQRCVLDVPDGWSSFVENKKSEPEPEGERERFSGRFDGIVATADGGEGGLVFDTHYLYLFHPPKRRLYVFVMDDKPMRPFGIVTFDSTGGAKPTKLPPVEE